MYCRGNILLESGFIGNMANNVNVDSIMVAPGRYAGYGNVGLFAVRHLPRLNVQNTCLWHYSQIKWHCICNDCLQKWIMHPSLKSSYLAFLLDGENIADQLWNAWWSCNRLHGWIVCGRSWWQTIPCCVKLWECTPSRNKYRKLWDCIAQSTYLSFLTMSILSHRKNVGVLAQSMFQAFLLS